MKAKKKTAQQPRLHPRNKNRERYDLEALIAVHPALKKYIKPNKSGEQSVDFANPTAVKCLNKAILHHYYGIENWEFPDENLCPPIPGRADYIHHIADLLSEKNGDKIPKGDSIRCLDIGTGANCIYPIIGVTEYGWQFVGTDIDPKSIASAKRIIAANPSLKNKVECRLQANPKHIFRNIIGQKERFDVTICNPPFHASAKAAQQGTQRKIKHLTGKKLKHIQLNFSGIHHELICEGGESAFIQKMIKESKLYAQNCRWFSTLVSKASNLKGIYAHLKKMEARQVKTIQLGTGNKSSRVVAWRFF